MHSSSLLDDIMSAAAASWMCHVSSSRAASQATTRAPSLLSSITYLYYQQANSVRCFPLELTNELLTDLQATPEDADHPFIDSSVPHSFQSDSKHCLPVEAFEINGSRTGLCRVQPTVVCGNLFCVRYMLYVTSLADTLNPDTARDADALQMQLLAAASGSSVMQ